MAITRRKFISAATILTFAPYSFAKDTPEISSPSQEPYADLNAADKWIDTYRSASHAVAHPLHIGRFADKIYYLLKDISWSPNPGQTPKPVTVPEGFVTDFASIPRAFWSILPTDGPYVFAAIIHDFLYWSQTTSRDEADLVLKYAMQDFKVGNTTIETIYSGVRIGGGFSWQENARLKNSGEKRVLTKYPENPTVRWTDWKLQKDNFA